MCVGLAKICGSSRVGYANDMKYYDRLDGPGERSTMQYSCKGTVGNNYPEQGGLYLAG